MDFHDAGVVHLIAKKYLKDYLEGKSKELPKEIILCKDCQFGKWLETGVIEKNPKIPELKLAERLHSELHAIINNIIKYKEIGDIKTSKSEYGNLEKKCKEFIGLLTILTVKM